MKKINFPILALIVANIIWGATPAIMKLSLQTVPIYFLAFTRFLMAAIILYPFIHKTAQYSDLKNKYLWVYAIFGITINILFFFFSLKYTTSINVSIIGSSGPILISIFGALVLKEMLKKREIIGTIVAFLGVAAIIFEPVFNYGLNGHVLGNVLIILATVGAVVATLAGRKFLTPQNTMSSTFWIFTIGAISFFPFMIYEWIQNPLALGKLDGAGILGLAFGILFSSITAYSCQNYALSKMAAHKASIFTYMDPIIAVLVAVPLLNEKITPVFVIGAILVFGGILIAQRRIPYHPLHKLFSLS